MVNQKVTAKLLCVLRNASCAVVVSFGFPFGAISEDSVRTADPNSKINGLSLLKDPGSGLTFRMPANIYRRERTGGSTTVADADGARYNIEVATAEGLYKTEADMIRVMEQTAAQNHDPKVEKNIKVHGFPAKEWSFTNDFGFTKVVVICTPKNYFTCMWHADEDKPELHKACDTFFSSLDPTTQL